uniref:DUF7642 domain-containing protein n=1 Tax=Cannabis sativa TaxID=3483 RepID=A0A803NT87_CANSA
MGTGDEVVEIDSLERGLLSGTDKNGAEDDDVLYSASFLEMEDNFVRYQTAQWVLYSLLLILAWGIGLFMLLYLPVRRYILRKDIRSKKLYLTPNSIVYKVARPVPFPFFGALKKEKYILLPSVADIVIEQGIANPNAFRKAVLMRLSNMRNEVFSRQVSTIDDVPNLRLQVSPSKSLRQDSFSHPGDLILLQKLEEVGTSVKRVQTLIEEQRPETSEHRD